MDLDKNRIEQDHLWDQLCIIFPQPHDESLTLEEELRTLEQARIVEALNNHDFNRTKTAQALGIGRTNLLAKCKRLEIELVA
jgi:transcriptional regulator with PAS, ATPase and Fis domain|tara:strand:- start:2622 stop:2867 length:246 start_codon:yes stop_codon:yes gene_type:complete